jgi:zinc D-Ala-D-Ala dipeptidase
MLRGLLKRIVLALVILVQPGFAAPQELPGGFAYLRDVEPSILQDMRYASSRNFTGKPVAGYDAPECVLARHPAEALKAAEKKAQSLGFSLKVYDCYRPARAVRAFLQWASAPDDGQTKFYYPHLKKSQLVPRYIASQSSHSMGSAVDLTLVRLEAAGEAAPEQSHGDCTAPASGRVSDNSVDMGTAFDCFDTKANTASTLATPGERKSRMLLKSIMESAGFNNYAGEWWHFAYGRATSGQRFDFPIRSRSGS